MGVYQLCIMYVVSESWSLLVIGISLHWAALGTISLLI